MSKNDRKPNTCSRNAGFSLLELIIAITIVVILSGLSTYGVAMLRRRNVESYAKRLSEQIQLTRQTAPTSGKDAILYLIKENNAYSVYRSDQPEKKITLCDTPEVQMDASNLKGTIPQKDQVSNMVAAWKFDNNTGECLAGYSSGVYAGIVITGYNRKYRINIYQENGYCEYTQIRTTE